MKYSWILGSLFLVGCQQQTPSISVTGSPHAAVSQAPVTPALSGTPAPHHEHKAPHGGALVELGEEAAHLEVVWEASSGKATIYCLDGECEKPLRSPQKELQLKLGERLVKLASLANPLTGETVGDSSQFEGLIPELKGKSEWEAEVVEIELQGQTYRDLDVDFPKGHHQHDHD